MTRRRTSRAHLSRSTIVNAIGLLVAIPAFSYSLYVYSPGALAESAGRLVADATMSLTASVPANPYNTLAQELSDKQAALDREQAQLSAKESAASGTSSSAVYFGLASFCISVLVLMLVGLNFYLDMRRKYPRADALSRKFLVDLR